MDEGIEDGEQHKSPRQVEAEGVTGHVSICQPASRPEQTCDRACPPSGGQARQTRYARLGGDEQSFEDGATAFLLRLRTKMCQIPGCLPAGADQVARCCTT